MVVATQESASDEGDGVGDGEGAAGVVGGNATPEPDGADRGASGPGPQADNRPASATVIATATLRHVPFRSVKPSRLRACAAHPGGSRRPAPVLI